jgi:hypothetical protein
MFWAPLAVLGFALLLFLGGQIVMALWNWLLPELFGWRTITFWQAIGLLALCRILFGGFGRHGSRRFYGRHRGRHGQVGDRVAERFAERMSARWDVMTPEERERFRERMRF